MEKIKEVSQCLLFKNHVWKDVQCADVLASTRLKRTISSAFHEAFEKNGSRNYGSLTCDLLCYGFQMEVVMQCSPFQVKAAGAHEEELRRTKWNYALLDSTSCILCNPTRPRDHLHFWLKLPCNYYSVYSHSCTSSAMYCLRSGKMMVNKKYELYLSVNIQLPLLNNIMVLLLHCQSATIQKLSDQEAKELCMLLTSRVIGM